MIWPEHIVHLAEAFQRGECDATDPLHDALIELGYPSVAYNHFRSSCVHHCKPGHTLHSGQPGCFIIWQILNKLPIIDHNFCSYLDQRGLDGLPWGHFSVKFY